MPIFNTIKTKGKLGILLAMIIIGCAFSASIPPAWSQEGETPIHMGYPLSFDGRGSLDGLDGNRVVINDASFRLANDATFNMPDFLNSGPDRFPSGAVVGFILNSNGEIESIWLIGKNAKKK